ncbi:MAG: hypothetical protein ACRD23_09270, partial [Terriglobales bacterium]
DDKPVLPTLPVTMDTPTLSHRTRKDGAPSKFVVSWEKGWATRPDPDPGYPLGIRVPALPEEAGSRLALTFR